MGDGTWKGTTQSQILHWQNQVRLYEQLVNPKDHFAPSFKCTMLQNMVHPVAELRQVKDQADQHKTQTGKDLTYDQYCNLLISAAMNYDAQFHTQSRPPHAKRTIYNHDIDSPLDSFDIDSDLDVIQAYATDQALHTCMSGSQWKRLPKPHQDIWDTLPDSSKAIILERPPPCHSANVHEAFQDMQMGSEPGDTEPPQSFQAFQAFQENQEIWHDPGTFDDDKEVNTNGNVLVNAAK